MSMVVSPEIEERGDFVDLPLQFEVMGLLPLPPFSCLFFLCVSPKRVQIPGARLC